MKIWKALFETFFIKSAETFAFKKKALGIAKNATKAIPNSTNSIVPVTGEFRNLLPKTSQKVSIAKDNNINPSEVSKFWLHQANSRMVNLIGSKVIGTDYFDTSLAPLQI